MTGCLKAFALFLCVQFQFLASREGLQGISPIKAQCTPDGTKLPLSSEVPPPTDCSFSSTISQCGGTPSGSSTSIDQLSYAQPSGQLQSQSRDRRTATDTSSNPDSLSDDSITNSTEATAWKLEQPSSSFNYYGSGAKYDVADDAELRWRPCDPE